MKMLIFSKNNNVKRLGIIVSKARYIYLLNFLNLREKNDH